MLRTRFAVAALLGVGLAYPAATLGQDTHLPRSKFKDDKGAFLPFYQEMYDRGEPAHQGAGAGPARRQQKS